MSRIRDKSAYTLIEILLVVTLIALLAAVVGPNIFKRLASSRRKEARINMEHIASALELYHYDNGFYPTEEQGLAALVEKPDMPPLPKQWRRNRYLKEYPLDPWNNDFVYELVEENGTQEFKLLCLGADGLSRGQGKNADIVYPGGVD